MTKDFRSFLSKIRNCADVNIQKASGLHSLREFSGSAIRVQTIIYWAQSANRRSGGLTHLLCPVGEKQSTRTKLPSMVVGNASSTWRLKQDVQAPLFFSSQSFGSQSSILFPSGSMIHANLPFSCDSGPLTTSTPPARNCSSKSSRLSTR